MGVGTLARAILCAIHLTPRWRWMGGPNLWVSKLRRAGGCCVGGRLADSGDPQVGGRHLAAAVSAEKRSMSKI